MDSAELLKSVSSAHLECLAVTRLPFVKSSVGNSAASVENPEKLLDNIETETAQTYEAQLNAWRELLPIIALPNNYALAAKILRTIRRLAAANVWPERQILKVYEAVCSVLAGQPLPYLVVHQTKRGAFLNVVEGFLSFGGVPNHKLQTEITSLVSLCAALSGSEELRKMADKGLRWFHDTLDYHGKPFTGLFTTEEECRDQQHVQPQTKSLLPSFFDDLSTALVCCRSPQTSAIATLYGNGSGMGCCRHGTVEIVSYGPQHLPLNECKGFGISGCEHELGKHLRRLSTKEGRFVIEGMSRPIGGNGEGVWIEVLQEYNQETLDISLQFYQMFERPIMAFSFFVKGKECRLEEGKILKPRTLNRYEGKNTGADIAGDGSIIRIESAQKHLEMHVIPLCGAQDFWGADFLIAYIMPASLDAFSWKILFNP